MFPFHQSDVDSEVKLLGILLKSSDYQKRLAMVDLKGGEKIKYLVKWVAI